MARVLLDVSGMLIRTPIGRQLFWFLVDSKTSAHLTPSKFVIYGRERIWAAFARLHV